MSIKTKFGSANINIHGYYVITSNREQNKDKMLHRLIYEDFWDVKLPSEIIIHHKDNNKLNNCILNLEAMTREEHNIVHKSGENNCNYGKPLSKETKKKISESISGENHPLFGKHHSIKSKLKMSESRNTSGYYRVSKVYCSTCKQGFVYVYQYTDETGKSRRIKSTNIGKLEQKVKNNDLDWYKIEKR